MQPVRTRNHLTIGKTRSLEHVESVVEERDTKAVNDRLANGWTILAIVPGSEGQSAHALYVLGKVPSLGEQAQRINRVKRGLPNKLDKICGQAARVLEGKDTALESLYFYSEEARSGRLDARTLRAFLHGIHVSGLLNEESYKALVDEL